MQRRHAISCRTAIACGCLLAGLLGGCDTPADLRAYAKETTNALVTLDQEFQQSAEYTARINNVRRDIQQRRAAELEESTASIRDQIVIWDLGGSAGKEKIRRFNVLRGNTSNTPPDLAPSQASTIDVKPTPAIEAISATAKATDALSKTEPLHKRAMFLFNYAKAVRDDIKKQEDARKAEENTKPTLPK
ncbi:hypothetical protein [Azospirillum argentinense]